MNQQHTETIPEGYRKNAKGHLVPEVTIRESDLAIDQFVLETAGNWIHLQTLIASFKVKLLGDVKALLDLIAEKYKVKKGGKKGNVQVFSFDGRYKLVVAVADNITFGPELQAAKQLICDCLTTWTQDSGAELKTIVNAAFDVDAAGNVNVGRILSLRRYNIDNENWRQAMKAISDAILVVGSKEYARLYERNHVGEYIAMPLDIAAL